MTKDDIIRHALMRLGVVAMDEPMTAQHLAHGAAVLASLVAEVGQERGLVSLAPDVVPVAAQMPLANLLAVDLAPDFGLPAPDARGRAWVRLAATLRSDDREDNPSPLADYY